MSKIAPFRAIYFNPETVKDYSFAISPLEYRVRSQAQLSEIAKRNQFNIARIIEPMFWQAPSEQEIQKLIEKSKEQKNVEEKLAELKQNAINEFNSKHAQEFSAWLELGKLYRDELPGMYIYSREYFCETENELKMQVGIVALLELDSPDASKPAKLIYKPPDELVEQAYYRRKYTFAQFSPCIVGFSDPKNSVKTTLKPYLQQPPNLIAFDEDGFAHIIRAIHDEGVIDALQKIFNDFQLGIIEGAHHYLAAIKFRDEMKRLEHFGSGTETIHNVLAYLLPLDGETKVEFEIINKAIFADAAESLKTKEPPNIAKLRKEAEKQTADTQAAIEISEDEKEFLALTFDEVSPLSVAYLKAWFREYFEVEELAWKDEPAELLETLENKLNVESERAVALLLPQKKTAFILKLQDERSVKALLGARKAQIYGFCDITVFWRSFLRKLFIGFDDDRDSIHFWDREELVQKLTATRTSQQNSKTPNIGLAMLFKQPSAKTALKFFEVEGTLSEQLFRIKYPPVCGLVSFRLALEDMEEVEEKTE